MKYIVSGKLIKNKKDQTEFKKEIEAETINHAKELIYAFFGSKNGLKRTMIKIEKIEKV